MAEIHKPAPLDVAGLERLAPSYPSPMQINRRRTDGRRYRVYGNIVDIFPLVPPLVYVRMPNKDVLLLPGVEKAEINQDAGMVLFERKDSKLMLLSDGSSTYVHFAPQEIQAEKQPRGKVSGFFGKVLDGFPRETLEGKTMYKLLVGNEVKQEDDTKKVAWTTVTALEPHVVRFLEQNLENFEKRKTILLVEGYYQEVEKQLRRSTKKVQEFYAMNMKQVP